MAKHGKNSDYSTVNSVAWKVERADGTIESDEYGLLVDLTAEEADEAVERLRERGVFATAVRDHY